MIIHYTKHAEEKFYILQRHGRQILKEDVTDVISIPHNAEKKHGVYFVQGTVSPDECWEVVYRKDESVVFILTFYPVSSIN